MVVPLKAEVPEDLLDRMLQQLGFRSSKDPIELRQPVLKSDGLDEILTELGGYYINFAAKRYLTTDMGITRYLTICRHVLRQRGRDFVSRETSERGRKIRCYRLSPTQAPPAASFEVAFD
jgi:hypothetical protein